MYKTCPNFHVIEHTLDYIYLYSTNPRHTGTSITRRFSITDWS